MPELTIDTAIAARLPGRTDAEGFPTEDAWETAPPISFCADWQGKNEDRRRATQVRLLWTPEFLFLPPSSYAPFPWKEEKGPDRYRRALYTFRRRSTPYPVLQVFDAPNGDSSCVRRLRSNTPLQALTALNETIFVECAQALARKHPFLHGLAMPLIHRLRGNRTVHLELTPVEG